MDKIVLKRAGLGTSGQTYLVDRSNALVSAERFGEQEFPLGVHSEGIEAAIQGIDGSGLYLNYEGVPVIGVYRWIGKWEVALLAEMNQQEAFAPAGRLAQMILLVGLISAGVLAAGVYLLARQITRPILAVTDAAVQVAAGDLERAVEVEREDEVGVLANAFNSMTAQQRDLIGNLEERVAERTAALQQRTTDLEQLSHNLEDAVDQNRRRALRLEASAYVARAVASVLDPAELLNQVVSLIADRVGFYHVGIFMLDEIGRYAVLRAANSVGGQRTLARGHRLRVGEQGIVGYVTGTGLPRIALDVGADAVHFANPDLPHTRSEMALPLVARGRILGALDVQSVEPEAFDKEDVGVLQTLADQIAVALDNARLFEESQASLRDVQAVQAQYTRQAWRAFSTQQEARTIEYTRSGVAPLGDQLLPELVLSPVEVVDRVSVGGPWKEGVTASIRNYCPGCGTGSRSPE